MPDHRRRASPGALDVNGWNVWMAVVEEERTYIDEGAF